MFKSGKVEKYFDEWQKKYGISVFVKDGIVCPDSYENVLYILKDVNNAKPEDEIDLRKSLVTRTDEGKTWFNVARWTLALLDNEDYEDKAIYMCATMQHEQMKRVAVVNIKKEAGGGSVSDAVVRKYAAQQNEELLSEISACAPKIIIVCGVGLQKAVEEIVGKIEILDRNMKMKAMKEAVVGLCEINGNKTPIVIYRHPANHCSAELSFDDMKHIKEYFKL